MERKKQKRAENPVKMRVGSIYNNSDWQNRKQLDES